MFGRKKKEEQKDSAPQPSQFPTSSALPSSMDVAVAAIDSLFADVDIMISRRFQNAKAPECRFCIYYSDGVTDNMIINEHIIEPLMFAEDLEPGYSLYAQVKDRTLVADCIDEATTFQQIIDAVTYGDTVLLIDGSNKALIINSKSFSLRSITEPEGEKVLSGPREGFTEGIMTNLSLVRRRMRSHELKIKMRPIGVQTKTFICIVYMDNIVNKKILGELYRRLDAIEIDGVLDSNYLSEYISEKSRFAIRSAGTTERPDVVAGRLLEGRIAIFVDGTPVVLTVPYLFLENFQSNEDYYTHPYYASYSRLLRVLSFVLTIMVPALYIAIVAYHHDVLPAPLLLSIARSQKNVPLPAAVECVVMLAVFDLLREAGVRMPSHVGQALSIVGALVIGQAAVEAQLVAAPMIIIVAIAGITMLMVPQLTITCMIARTFFLVLASIFGLAGLVVGASILLIHIINLESFGVPSLLPSDELRFQDVKDTFVRAPWPLMVERLRPMSYNARRMAQNSSGKEQAK